MTNLEKYLILLQEGEVDSFEHKVVNKQLEDAFKKINLAIKHLDVEEYEKVKELLILIAQEVADAQVELNAAVTGE